MGTLVFLRAELLLRKLFADTDSIAHIRLRPSVTQIGSYDIMATSPFSSGDCVSMELVLSSLGPVFSTDPLEVSVRPYSLSGMAWGHWKQLQTLI